MAERVDTGTAMDVGDEGIWVTFARGMTAKAVREFKELCDEVGRQAGSHETVAPDGEGATR